MGPMRTGEGLRGPALRTVQTTGRCFIFSCDGHNLTNHHVTEDCAAVRILHISSDDARVGEKKSPT
jgi:S1-C subfamily serine protease